MRRLLITLVGLTLLFGQSSGPTGLTGAAATANATVGMVVVPPDDALKNAGGKMGVDEQNLMRGAVIVGAVVANVAAASIDQKDNR